VHPADRLKSESSGGILAGKHLLLCVTGSIAAVETVKLVREFLRNGADVTVAMTESATRIVHPDGLWFASGKKVITAIDGDVQHVSLCGSKNDGVDAVLVAPCTANMISKLASGICDDAVSTILITALGSGKPILISPGMHGAMLSNKVIKENIRKVESLGVEIIPPVIEEGKAKMADIETIYLATGRKMLERSLKGRKVTIIGGSTIEPIDSVRFISNVSTGGTSIALAKTAYLLGADVELIMGQCKARLPAFVKPKRFETVADLQRLVSGRKFDIVIVPAAISDYRVDKPVRGKLPSDEETVTLTLKKTKKVIDSISARVLVGFKLESGITVDQLLNRARARMKSAGMTMIVANRLEDVTDIDSRAFLIGRSGKEMELKGTRDDIARGILENIGKVVR
jgi:phosphopantothenoylcysteine decarboxylase / phosphopantothenate---cysteine ligase